MDEAARQRAYYAWGVNRLAGSTAWIAEAVHALAGIQQYVQSQFNTGPVIDGLHSELLTKLGTANTRLEEVFRHWVATSVDDISRVQDGGEKEQNSDAGLAATEL